KVAVVYNRSKETAEEVADAIQKSGSEAILLQYDVSNPDGAAEVVQQTVEKWGKLDILVNSAGIIRDKLFVQMSPEDWKAVIDTNLNGTFYFCKAAGKEMMGKRSGSIINI